MSQCRSCFASIIWVKTQNGRSMPLDPDPSPEGNVMLDDGVALVFGNEAAADVRLSGQPLYLSHFSTCPDSKAHRKAKR